MRSEPNEANRVKRVWWALLGGCVCGFICFLVGVVFVALNVFASPGDPTAGAVAIMIPLVVLPASLVGLVLGLVVSTNRGWGVEADTPPTGRLRSRRDYVKLGLLFGLSGCHNYYAGYHGRAIAQASVSLLLLCAFGFPILFIWVLIDLFSVTHDANGRRMT